MVDPTEPTEPPPLPDGPPADDDTTAPDPEIVDLLSTMLAADEDIANPEAVARAQALPPLLLADLNLTARTTRHGAWVTAGKPFSIAYPVIDVASRLHRYGYPVGMIGNNAHQLAIPAEDHDPYSQTGWPGWSPEWWVFAFDLMNPPAGSGLPSLALIAAQMIADKVAGHPAMAWLKYINWTPQGAHCRCDSFEPSHRTSDSSDVGHNHHSCRTDFRLSRSAKDYDPVARVRAAHVVPIIHPAPATVTPPWPGRVLIARTGKAMMSGSDVKVWQQRMSARGWPGVKADGWFGQVSADLATKFQRDCSAHGWHLDADGKVGADTWRATFLRPIS